MDTQPTLDISTIYHADRDILSRHNQINQYINIIQVHPRTVISALSVTPLDPLPSNVGVPRGLFLRGFHRPDTLDLSRMITREDLIAIGEHADLYGGKMIYKKVAIKVFRGGSWSNQAFVREFKQRLECGALVWQHLKHPHVSEFYGLAFNFGYMPALILPFYGNGTVVDYVKEKNNEVKLNMVEQIAQGLDYLHRQSIVHGDLRGSNVLIDGEGHPRIGDYGLEFILEPSEFTSIKTAGTCRWTAPEIIDPPEDVLSVNDSFALFTMESDVYAFAMTVIEIFTGKIPFYKRINTCVILAVREGGRPELPPFLKEQKGFRELIQECWHQEPSKRPTCRAVNQRLSMRTPEQNTAWGVGNSRWLTRFVSCTGFCKRPEAAPKKTLTRAEYFSTLMFFLLAVGSDMLSESWRGVCGSSYEV